MIVFRKLPTSGSCADDSSLVAMRTLRPFRLPWWSSSGIASLRKMRHNLRIMRKTGIADALFTKTRQRILSTLVLNPDRAWYLSDLAHHANTTPSSLQRDLTSLVQAGILIRTKDGNRTYYRADKECPVYPELHGLLLKTAGLVDQVKQTLSPLSASIRAAFIFGSIAANAETSSSDVDLLVIGKVRLASLSKILKPLEDALSRPVNPSLYSEAEFRDKVRDGNHFLTTVLNERKLFIIGSESDLATIRDRGAAEAPPNVEEGARRSKIGRKA